MSEAFDEVRAYAYALRLLGMREYCEAQMQERLRAWAVRHEMPCSDDDANGVIRQLKQAGLLDEERFVQSFFRMRLARGDTPRLAAIRARQKGAHEGVVECVFEEVREGFDCTLACQQLLDKRDPAGRRFNDARIWRRQARYLQQKGFDAATILRTMKGEPSQ